MIKRILNLALCMAIVCSMTTITFADETTFKDVTTEHNYYESIEWAADAGIVHGCGDGKFNPDSQVTVRQLCIMLARARDMDMSKRDELAIAYDHNWIDMHTIAHADQYPDVCIGNLYDIVFKAFNIPIYNFTGEGWKEAFNQAKLNDICSEDADYYKLATRAEAVHAIRAACDELFKSEKPQILNEYNIIIESKAIDYNNCIKSFLNIPQPILDEFKERGWKLVIGHDRIYQYNNTYNTSAIGLCSYSDKAIYVNCLAPVKHEIGHFLDECTNYDKEFYNIYLAEKGCSLFDNHARSDSAEYFAESFSLYIRSGVSNKTKDKLSTEAPLTYEFFKNLEENNWGL